MLDLDTPDDFRGDPYGWLTNQMSHVLAGLAGAWLVALFVRTVGFGACPAGCVGVAAVALTSASLEALQLRRGGTLGDSLQDFAFILAGALWTASGGALPLWLAVAVGLAVGTAHRARITAPSKD